MKYIAIFFIATIALAAAAPQPQAVEDLQTLLEMQTGVNNALQTVWKYIVDLKLDIEREQREAHALYLRQMAYCRKTSARLRAQIARTQKEIADLKKHLAWLVGERTDTRAKIAFDLAKLEDNNRRYHQLRKQRCDDNFNFIWQMKQHRIALQLIDVIENTIKAYFAKRNAKMHGKVHALIEELSTYHSLLEGDGKTELVQAPKNIKKLLGKHYVAARTKKQIGTGHVSHKEHAQKIRAMKTPNLKSFEGTVEATAYKMLARWRNHLNASMGNLANAEAKANVHFVEFLLEMETENRALHADILVKRAYEAKLDANIATTRSVLKATESRLAHLQLTLKHLLAKCAAEKAFYIKETARRKGELVVVGKLMDIFRTRIAHMKKYMKARINGKKAGAMGHRVVAQRKNIGKFLNKKRSYA